MIRNHYAFPQMRELQKKLITEILLAFEGYDDVLLEVPTGGGKSGIIASLALALGESYIGTGSILLQEQYLRDFAWIRSIKGKSNFECIDPITAEIEKARQEALFAAGKPVDAAAGPITCESGRCMVEKKYRCALKPKKSDFVVLNRGLGASESIRTLNPESVFCHYYSQKTAGLMAGHSIMNYKYLLSMFFYSGEEMARRSFMAFDEAHALEGEAIDFLGITVSKRGFEAMQERLLRDPKIREMIGKAVWPKTKLESIDTWLEYLKQTLDWMNMADGYYESLYLKNELDKRDKDNQKKVERLLKKVDRLITNISDDPGNWVVDIRYELDRTRISEVKLVPIEAGRYIADVFSLGKKRLFCSATILDKEAYCKMVGLDPKLTKFIRVDESPFAVESRPIEALNIGTMNYRTMQGLLPIVAMNVDSIMNQHIEERGILHVTSYAQADYIQKNVSRENRARLVMTDSRVRQAEILERHSSTPNSVLLSPSLYQGVDLKDDLARFQVIVKVPYPDLSDKRTAVKLKTDPRWYEWYTSLRLVQTSGRIVRNESDYGITYILDSNINRFMNNRLIPKWFKESVTMKCR